MSIDTVRFVLYQYLIKKCMQKFLNTLLSQISVITEYRKLHYILTNPLIISPNAEENVILSELRSAQIL